MSSLNKSAAGIMLQFPISACTDITGFGLLGHLHEMTSASRVDAEIDHTSVPVLPGVFEMTSAGTIPGGTLSNKDYMGRYVIYTEQVSELVKIILNDAQTSGGLLIAIPENFSEKIMQYLIEAGTMPALIGKIIAPGNGQITVRNKHTM
jgi:selenide,water dikinase